MGRESDMSVTPADGSQDSVVLGPGAEQPADRASAGSPWKSSSAEETGESLQHVVKPPQQFSKIFNSL